MKQLITIVVVTMLTLSAYAQKSRTTYKVYTDKQKGYIINYPSTWGGKTMAGAEFFIHRPVEEQGQRFMENMNLVKGDAEDIYLVEYVMDAEQKMKRDMPDFKIIGGGYGKIGDLDVFRMFYTFSAGNKKEYKMHNVVYIMLKDSKGYSLTGSALESTFKRFFPIFDSMSRSFRITTNKGK